MAPLVVNAGKAIITNRIRAGGTEPLFVANGTGSTAEALTQTALTTEVDTRASGTSSQQTVTTANDTYQVVGTITAGATRAIQEVGLFDASSVGNMLCRAVVTVINLLTGDAIQWTIKVQFV